MKLLTGITKDAMSTVNGESVNTMDTLSALAKKMGSETAFSASECAEALNYGSDIIGLNQKEPNSKGDAGFSPVLILS
ncbi:MAG: hypothetical protein HFH30_15000 [Eubacterium sp.]|nr:hypothetical protein [Eubacterium sp.]